MEDLLDLLAVVHKDGGHHTNKVGLNQSIQDAKDIYYSLRQENEEMREAMQRFVDKVDRREARSVRTYQEFKQLLAR